MEEGLKHTRTVRTEKHSLREEEGPAAAVEEETGEREGVASSLQTVLTTADGRGSGFGFKVTASSASTFSP